MGKSLSRVAVNDDNGRDYREPTDYSNALVVSLEEIKPRHNRRSASEIPNPSFKLLTNKTDKIVNPELESGDSLLSIHSGNNDQETFREESDELFFEDKDYAEELEAIFRSYTPTQVLHQHAHKLTPYEKMEISQYQNIYCFGQYARKRPGEVGRKLNSSYDDVNGFYWLIRRDHLAYRYETYNILGRGSFAEVVRAYDHKYKEFVAIKIMLNRPTYLAKAEKEIHMLEFLKKKDACNTMNLVHLKNAFVFRSHVCMVFELMSDNIYHLITANKEKGFSMQFTRKLTIPILYCLNSLSQLKIMHGDLKPENILKQKGNKGLKIADFGMSRFVKPGDELTSGQIQTRWFRAPEVLLGYPYGIEIDMWSLGCIVAEFITGSALFKGEDEGDQLALIIEQIGLPPEEILNKSKRKHVFFHQNGTPRYYNVSFYMDLPYIAGRSCKGKPRGYPGSKSLASAIGDDDPELLDFIGRCLTWDPTKRMTPRAALHHPWLKRKSAICSLDSHRVPLRLRRSFEPKPKKRRNSKRYSKKDYPLLRTPAPKKCTAGRQKMHTSEIINESFPPECSLRPNTA